jgi:hypothetical protein
MDPAEACGRVNTLESAHRPRPLFDASMVLLQMIIQVAVGAMTHLFPQLRFDRAGIGVMPVGRNALRDTFGTVRADRKNASTAALSRFSLRRTSTRFPARSIAR